MALAVISDIHSNIAALEAVLDDIARRGIDRIVNLRDSLSGPFDGPATADLLTKLDLVTVRGNHDRQLVDRPKETMGLWEQWVIDDLSPRQLDWIRALPLTADCHGAFLCHGTPTSDEKNWLFLPQSAILTKHFRRSFYGNIRFFWWAASLLESWRHFSQSFLI